jgi:hypothetical protein
MKKQYKTPDFEIVSLFSTEIIATSSDPLGIGKGSSDASIQYGKHRDPIWDEDE